MRKILVITLALIAIACSRGDKRPNIPYVFVDRNLYVNSMDYIPISGYKYVNDGYRGIVVYRVMENQFAVFERCCPHDPEHAHAMVHVEPSGVICIDSICKSRFNLIDGGKVSGPSIFPLQMYRYTYDGEKLHIFN